MRHNDVIGMKTCKMNPTLTKSGVVGGVTAEHSGDFSKGVPGGIFSASRSETELCIEQADTGRC